MKNDLSFELIDGDVNKKKAILGSWATHYKSWKSFKSVKGLFIKYEDIVNDTENVFLKIINYLNKVNNLEINKKKINDCIENTNFNKLRDLEKKDGFTEKGKNPFFRSGEIGHGKRDLSTKILCEIEKIFNKEMKELGYL